MTSSLPPLSEHMDARCLRLALTLLVLATGGRTGSASAQAPVQVPSQQHASVRPPSAVSVATLPAPNVQALRREDRAQTGLNTPYRYGRSIDTTLSAAHHGTWERLPSGRWLWRLRLHTPDAVSMSVGFSRFELPQGAQLYLHGPSGSTLRGPYTSQDATEGKHWTPLLRGDEVIVELEVPADRRSALRLVVGTVVHGYRSLPTRRKTNARSQSGTCNLDVACPEADPWSKQVRAVGGYTVQRGGDNLFCSGTLLNNTSDAAQPLFLTAEHCVQTPAQAASMVFYWNFETAQCRRPGTPANGSFPRDSLDVGAWGETSTGAVLRARYGNVHEQGTIAGKPDLLLVEVDDTIPGPYNLYLSGWSRANAPTDEGVTIHHPSGHAKRISFDRDPTRITGWGQSMSGSTHLRVGNWDTGTTEPGSSGGPLLNTSGHVVGVLSGGTAGCGGDGDAGDNNQPDWYGRLAAGFTRGDYQDVTFAEVLDPTNSGANSVEGRPLVRDATPPGRPGDFRVAAVTADSVTLRWTAPGDDGATGTADAYRLRRRTGRAIDSRSAFETARSVSSVPAPQPAGTPQSVTVAVAEDSSYYFALVAVDEVQNASTPAATEQDATPVSTLRVIAPPSPNPSRVQATLAFVVDRPQPVRATLYDALGRRVRTLLDEEVQPYRRRSVTVDVTGLSSGIYFVHIQGPSGSRAERLAVVK